MDDVRLSFRGDSIANNSIVVISEIGDSMSTRIQCTTVNPNQKVGRWFFPNGREVLGRGSGRVIIYRSRNNLGAVMLGNRNNATGPTGLYRCTIPDRFGDEQTLIVGIYSTCINSELVYIVLSIILILYIAFQVTIASEKGHM